MHSASSTVEKLALLCEEMNESAEFVRLHYAIHVNVKTNGKRNLKGEKGSERGQKIEGKQKFTPRYTERGRGKEKNRILEEYLTAMAEACGF